MLLQYIHYDNEIVGIDEGKVVANVTFPYERDGVVNVDHVFVDAAYRGKNIAKELMMELVLDLDKTNRVAVLTCPYAVRWFRDNPQYSRFVVHIKNDN